ncbi:MAG: hypothetical protein ACREUF_17030 [Solimonas sp.]
MTTAICLLTADRPEYTRRTLEALDAFRPSVGYHYLHADDGSQSGENVALALKHRFKTVYRSKERKGPVAALRAMWAEARTRGASHILHLENDIEIIAPIPGRRDADSVRLYGDTKSPGGARSKTGTCIIGTKEPIVWKWDGDGWFRGVAHWGGQPSITRTDLLLDAVAKAKKVKHIALTLARMDSLKPAWPVAIHFGKETTPNHKIESR